MKNWPLFAYCSNYARRSIHVYHPTPIEVIFAVWYKYHFVVVLLVQIAAVNGMLFWMPSHLVAVAALLSCTIGLSMICLVYSPHDRLPLATR